MDTLVGLQTPDQLAVADVHRDDLRGTLVQQHIGETAGRRAGVEAATPRHLQPLRRERLEGAEEFVGAAGRPGDLVAHLGDDQRRVRFDGGRRLGGHRAGDQHPTCSDQFAGVLA